MGAGMEGDLPRTVRCATSYGKQVAVVTDARFSGVSTGACIGHVSPEALAGGPIGRLRDGDLIEIVIDTRTLDGSLNFIGESGREAGAEEGSKILERRGSRPDLAADAALPDDTPSGPRSSASAWRLGRSRLRHRRDPARDRAGSARWGVGSDRGQPGQPGPPGVNRGQTGVRPRSGAGLTPV